MSVPASITSILLHRENGLVAVTCDDLTVRVVDIETRRVVRELSGFRGTILDLVRKDSQNLKNLLIYYCYLRIFLQILDGL